MNEKKKLTFLQKLENFWYYYKWRVISAVLLVFVVYLCAQIFKENTTENPRDLTIVSALAHPLTVEEYDIDKRLKDFAEDIDNDGEKSIVLSPYYITEKRTSDTDLVAQAQLENHFKNAKGDLLIFDEPNLSYYLNKDIFAPLDDYVDLSGIPDEDIVRQNGIAVALKLSDSKILKDMHFIIDEVYAGVLFVPDDADEMTLKSRDNTRNIIAKLLEK